MLYRGVTKGLNRGFMFVYALLYRGVPYRGYTGCVGRRAPYKGYLKG